MRIEGKVLRVVGVYIPSVIFVVALGCSGYGVPQNNESSWGDEIGSSL